jgi:hypothetical protein
MLTGGQLTEEETPANYGVNVSSPPQSFQPEAFRVIDDYSFGCITVDGKEYRSDIIILPHTIVPQWRRQEGHLLQLVDIEQHEGSLPRLLVLGTGRFGMMHVAKDLQEWLCSRHITLIAERTGAACKAFNHSLYEGRPVAGAFHLTC